jgi:hypothetical protein
MDLRFKDSAPQGQVVSSSKFVVFNQRHDLATRIFLPATPALASVWTKKYPVFEPNPC